MSRLRSFIDYQLPRIRNQLGVKLSLKSGDYRVRGYVANRLAISLDHEPYLALPLERALKARPGLFIDIGVNTGQTLLRLLSIEPSRRYLGIEPQIGCCFFVSQFIRDNGLVNARILPLALSDIEGVFELSASDGFDEMASLMQSGDRRDVTKVPVPVRTGDALLRDLRETDPAIIKIDVEGAELQVLQGLRETLARAKPILFFEVLANFVGHERTAVAPDVAERNRAQAAGIAEMLIGLGYRLHQIDTLGAERAIAAFDLDSPSTYIGRDYVAYPA